MTGALRTSSRTRLAISARARSAALAALAASASGFWISGVSSGGGAWHFLVLENSLTG
jgi:hypothetical protein